MQIPRYPLLLRRWWWFLALALLLGASSAYGISRLITPIYRGEVTLLVNQTQTPGTIAYNDILTSERLTLTYQELLTKRPVLEDVIRDLQLSMTPDALAAITDVHVIDDTQLLRLSVDDPDPLLAQTLANAIAEAFIASNEEDGLTRPGSVSIVEPAITPTSPVSPRTTLNTLMGALAGVFVAGLVAIAYEYLDDTTKTAEDVELATGLPTLGGVARFPAGAGSGAGLAISNPRGSAVAEAYRVLRTNLQFSTLEARTLLISSANPREGKSTTVANLAVAIAQTGARVIVVDSDLRRPALHRTFGLANGAGLTTALLSKNPEVARLLQPTLIENLRALTSGPLPPNPSELLSSKRMDAVVEALRQEAEFVLFDSPPALAVADASALADKVDGAIFVVDAGRTRAQALRRAVEAVARSKTRVVGAVLNKLRDRSRAEYYYGYYGSGDGTNDSGRRRRAPWSKLPGSRAGGVLAGAGPARRFLLFAGLALLLTGAALGLAATGLRLAWDEVPPPGALPIAPAATRLAPLDHTLTITDAFPAENALEHPT